MKLRTQMQIIAAIAALLFFASCSKTNEQGKYVPADAAVVIHINGQSIANKLPWDEIKGNALFQKMYADSTIPSFVKKVLDNPENSGINTKGDIIFFVKQDSLGSLIGLEGSIKDAEKFKLFNLDLIEGGNESDKGDLHFISKTPTICAGWNKEKFAYMFSVPGMGRVRYTGNYGGGMDEIKTRDMLLACKDIFDLKEKNSLGSNEKFTALMKKEGDVHFWLNAEELTKQAKGIQVLSMMKMDNLYKGSVTVGSLNFENGKIAAEFTSYAGKEITDLVKKYSGSGVNEEMLKRIPSKDVAGVLALNFKPEGIRELLKMLGMDGLANIGLAQLGFTLDDFIKANKGDILIAVTGIKSKSDTMPFFGEEKISKRGEPDILFAASIGDKESFNKLIEAGKKITGPQSGNMLPFGADLFYNSNANYFAIGNSKDNVDKYIAGGNNNYDFVHKLSGNPFGGYVNMQYILKSFQSQNSEDSSAKVIFDESVKMWENIYFTGGKYSDGGISYSIEVNLVDKATNSLKQLNQYIGKLGAVAMARKKKYELSDVKMEEIMSETTPPLPPPPPAHK